MSADGLLRLHGACEQAGLEVLEKHSRRWSVEFRRRWRAEFALPRADWRWVKFDWEVLGTELAPALLRRSAIREFNLRREEVRRSYVATSLDYREVLEVEGVLPEHAWWRAAARGEDLYIVPSDWAWTFVSTHEEQAMGIGPFFVENVRALMVER